jgi:5-methylcytosine-specific restriction endonuclease McrA
MANIQTYLVPVEADAFPSKTKWVCICPNCQQERLVSYARTLQLKDSPKGAHCYKCSIELGFRQETSGNFKLADKALTKENSRKARIGVRRPKSSQVMLYRTLFNNESLRTPEMREAQRQAKLGKYGPETNHWEGGKSKERKLIHSRDDYKQLRKQVFERDDYTCQICSKRGGDLEMDHIKEWCNYPELRLEPTNCRVLCKPCHKLTDNFGNKAKKKKAKVL